MTGPPEVAPALPGAVLRRTRTSIAGADAGATTWAVTVVGPTPVRGTDPRILRISLPVADRLETFRSSWGQEFEPTTLPTDADAVLEVTSGRSSHGAVPWLAVRTSSGAWVVSVHWSGNWRVATRPTADELVMEVGLRAAGQRVRLGAGERVQLPAVTVGWGADVEDAAAALVQHLGTAAPPGPLLTEWNPWWPYEDADITEQVFLDNAAVAARLGFDVAVLDAGWFGRADAGTDWFAERGDWHLTNTARFPHGLDWLAERTRERGIGFGIWVEAEAVGADAAVAVEHPELLALDPAGAPLGHLCLGSPAAREHVLGAVGGLLDRTQARWVKWDFNLDPGDGCARADHGHHADDGLLQHYRGLYAVLDALRSRHPGTVWEACSSGGLRIDAGLAEHVHAFFLSDPDWTEHALTCLWGAARQLPARQLLHWLESEWRGEHPSQRVDYSGPQVTLDQFDAKVRAALLHRFGASVRLTAMRPDLQDRLAGHLALHAAEIRPLLAAGVLRPLTPQPLREGLGHRQPAFQLSAGDVHVVAGFRLPPASSWQPVRMRGLDADATYAVRAVEGSAPGAAVLRGGQDLLEQGLQPPGPATSALWLVARSTTG